MLPVKDSRGVIVFTTLERNDMIDAYRQKKNVWLNAVNIEEDKEKPNAALLASYKRSHRMCATILTKLRGI